MILALSTLLMLTAAVLVALGVLGRIPVATLLRRVACGLTLASTLALAPWTFAETGALSGVLLGVPVVLIMAVVLADLSQRRVRLATLVCALLLLVWSMLLVLGVGPAFVPPGLLLLTSAGLESRRISSKSRVGRPLRVRGSQR